MAKSKDNIAISKESQPILKKIYDILQNIISIKSLWMFRYVPQIHSFKSWGYLAKDKEVAKAYRNQRLKRKIAEQIIPEDIGSIGKAFKQEKENQDWLFVPNTYKAPEGTIVELDLLLGHQSVLFVPFKNKDDNDIIAILLLSTSAINTTEDIAKKQQKIRKALKKSFINDLVRLAYRNERNKDVIANVKKATMGSVNIDTTLEDFVKKYLIDSIKEFNQGTSFVPIIKIVDQHHLQKPQWGYAEVVYENLRQKLSDHIKKGKVLSKDDPIGSFVGKGQKAGSHEFKVNLGGCEITYVLKGEVDVYEKMINNAIEKYKRQVEEIITQYEEKRDIKLPSEISWIIKKKYISEKLDQTCHKDHKDGRSPFYFILKKSGLFDNDELITCNLDKTLFLEKFRDQLIDDKGSYYKYQSQDYSPKIIPGLVFKVYTDEERKNEEIFNEDVKAFIDQRCLYYKLLLDEKQAKKDAVRAAIAQVMARNMSHNFGSHVYSRLIDDKVYMNLEDSEVKNTLKNYTPLFDDKEVFKDKEDHQLQFFFQYQKSRMDYLSEITFGIPNLITTKMMYGDVMKELDRVRILLNYISGVSEFKYKFNLKYNNKSLKNNDIDIGVAFPSDVLGCHAFYNIIENIIRNTAKHAGKKNQSNKPITFTIHFKDIKGYDGVEGVDELYCVEIDNGVREDNIEELVKQQNKRFNDSVLENNKLRSSSLGLLEMEASAAFLRQIDMPEIESDDYEVNEDKDIYFHELPNGTKLLNIIRAFAIAVKEEDRKNEKKVKTGRLGYRFFVQKPKEFLFVGNWHVADAKKKELLNFGIQIISANQFMTDLEKEKAFAHQFLIYDNSLCKVVAEKLKKARNISIEELYEAKEQLRSYSTLLPLRRLKISEEEKITISSYLGGKKQDNASNEENKQTEYFDCVGRAFLQKLKEFAWERYFEKVIEKELDATGKEKGITLCNDFQSNNKSQVDFLDHSYESKVMDYGTRGRFRKKHEVFAENLTSWTQEKLPRFSELSNYNEEAKPAERYINHIENDGITYLKQEIFEAYHNKVIILDERVQKYAEENSEGSAKDGQKLIPCWRLFGSTNIDLPRRPKKDEKGNIIPLKDWNNDDLKDWDGTNFNQEKVFSLDPNDFDKNNKEMVENYVNSRLDNAIILIHYGVLERMYKGEEGLINNTLKAWAAKAKRVVVTSGRGAHSLNLPESVCFVNLSPVLYACIENRNKYLINYLLNQSRRKNG